MEGFFAAPTKRRLRRGAFVGVDLQTATNRNLADPKAFRWKANPDKVGPDPSNWSIRKTTFPGLWT